VSRSGRALGLTQVARIAKAHATPAGEATSAARAPAPRRPSR
jgi:hypothetical protein